MLPWVLCKLGMHQPVMIESHTLEDRFITLYSYWCARGGCTWSLTP